LGKAYTYLRSVGGMSIKARIELLASNSHVLVRFDISKEDLPDTVVTEVCQISIRPFVISSSPSL